MSAVAGQHEAMWKDYREWRDRAEPVQRSFITERVRSHLPDADRLILDASDQGADTFVLTAVQTSVGERWLTYEDIDDVMDDDDLSGAITDLSTFEEVPERGSFEYDLDPR